MSDLLNPKKEKPSLLLSNIKIIKIFAIILGLLIIVGLFFLFLGLAKSYNKLNNKQISNKNLINNIELPNKFIFNQPDNAELISSSLGNDNQILLRYLYNGKNTLVILNVKTKAVMSIITIKKGQDVFKSN